MGSQLRHPVQWRGDPQPPGQASAWKLPLHRREVRGLHQWIGEQIIYTVQHSIKAAGWGCSRLAVFFVGDSPPLGKMAIFRGNSISWQIPPKGTRIFPGDCGQAKTVYDRRSLRKGRRTQWKGTNLNYIQSALGRRSTWTTQIESARIVQEELLPDCKWMVVLKSNGYGHGAATMAPHPGAGMRRRLFCCGLFGRGH